MAQGFSGAEPTAIAVEDSPALPGAAFLAAGWQGLTEYSTPLRRLFDRRD